jgi:hypothetical protein
MSVGPKYSRICFCEYKKSPGDAPCLYAVFSSNKDKIFMRAIILGAIIDSEAIEK